MATLSDNYRACFLVPFLQQNRLWRQVGSLRTENGLCRRKITGLQRQHQQRFCDLFHENTNHRWLLYFYERTHYVVKDVYKNQETMGRGVRWPFWYEKKEKEEEGGGEALLIALVNCYNRYLLIYANVRQVAKPSLDRAAGEKNAALLEAVAAVSGILLYNFLLLKYGLRS